MCCEREWRDREQYRELSRLEYAAGSTDRDSRPKCDPELAVKRFKRPDAGAPPPSAAELRPLPVLRHTVDFLLQLWQRRAEAAPLDRFAFISDRLRAVMQDISVQRLASSAAELLARIARFHALMELAFCAAGRAQNTMRTSQCPV